MVAVSCCTELLQYVVAVCCSVLQCVAVTVENLLLLQFVEVCCCIVLHCTSVTAENLFHTR